MTKASWASFITSWAELFHHDIVPHIMLLVYVFDTYILPFLRKLINHFPFFWGGVLFQPNQTRTQEIMRTSENTKLLNACQAVMFLSVLKKRASYIPQPSIKH